MFSRAYTSLSRITIEAADCKFNYQHINGHLTISVEPLDPVFPIGNRDPLLGQTSRQRIDNTTRNNDITARDKDNPQPSTSYAQHNPMLADSTHRSPKVPSDSLEPLQLNPSAVPSTSNLSPVPLKYEEENILKMMIQILILKMMNNKLQHPLICLIQSTCLNKKMKCHQRIYLKMKHKLKDHIP